MVRLWRNKYKPVAQSYAPAHGTKACNCITIMKIAGIAVIAAITSYEALSVMAQVDLSFDPYSVTSSMASLLDASDQKNLTTYATDLTRNLVPKMLHSHNDYWRDIPFYSALSVGAISVEADVWLINNTLYVRSVSALINAIKCIKLMLCRLVTNFQH